MAQKQPMTARQREAKMEQARQRAERAAAAKERKERGKKIFTIVVCVILVLALCIPTMAIAVLSA